MPAPGFYRPVERGLELKIAEKMASLRSLNQAKSVKN
jgi:putative ATPase